MSLSLYITGVYSASQTILQQPLGNELVKEEHLLSVPSVTASCIVLIHPRPAQALNELWANAKNNTIRDKMDNSPLQSTNEHVTEHSEYGSLRSTAELTAPASGPLTCGPGAQHKTTLLRILEERDRGEQASSTPHCSQSNLTVYTRRGKSVGPLQREPPTHSSSQMRDSGLYLQGVVRPWLNHWTDAKVIVFSEPGFQRENSIPLAASVTSGPPSSPVIQSRLSSFQECTSVILP
ncbi:unnamed protein product [Pleuronectes platessa]|uniref:Uncharacterized protein n=1 Tax=Pleuronectes platessa TaxID=8262 RepID=A0A9N7TTN8_PLEPL|nr:unnamed protein product [Pleuronectes platessa]